MGEVLIIPEIERIATENQIAADGMMAMQAKFAPHFQSFAVLAQEARTVQEDEPKRARALRLKIRAVRIAADDARKELKADSLRRSKAIDGINHILLHSLVPIEEGLEKIEKAEEIREKARKEALARERFEVLIVWTEHPEHFNLGEMPEAQFQELVGGMKSAHEAKIAAERAAQAKMEAEIEAELAERARIREENARLAKLAEDERKERERVEAAARAERIAHDAKIAAERAEAARLAKIESDKREAVERALRDQERKERQEAEAKAHAAIAAERKAREEAERKAKYEQDRARAVIAAREKAEREAREAADREAKRRAAAPDQEKLETLALAIDAIAIPQLSDEKMRDTVADQLGKLASWIRRTAAGMVA